MLTRRSLECRKGTPDLMMLVLIVALALANGVLGEEVVANQLQEYLDEHPKPTTLTTSWGKPVEYYEANDVVADRFGSIILNHPMFESMGVLTRERLPIRAVHPNGAGAYGYFEVTHDVSNITDVKLFNTVGKKTPIFMRFSPTVGEYGSPELMNRNKGIAIKFYSEEGNMDVAGFNINAFALKDPVYANVFIHSLKPNPKTGLRDLTMTWDFISQIPSALHASIMPLSAGGQPRSYASMPGHALHTYQVQNSTGHAHLIKINWWPVGGIQNLTNAELSSLIGTSADYHTKDLYTRIGNGTYPEYTLTFQVIPLADVEKVPFDVADITMNWPEKDYPNYPVGKLVLNKNPENYQASVEMAAFNPGNLPPGIRGCDKIYETRIFIYREGHLNRMGAGFNKIPVNCPMAPVHTYNRDGAPPVGDNGGDAPNYYPNSFHGPEARNITYAPLYRPDTSPGFTNGWQVKNYINDFSAADKTIWVDNMVTVLNSILPEIQEKILKIFDGIDAAIGSLLRETLAEKQASG